MDFGTTIKIAGLTGLAAGLFFGPFAGALAGALVLGALSGTALLRSLLA